MAEIFSSRCGREQAPGPEKTADRRSVAPPPAVATSIYATARRNPPTPHRAPLRCDRGRAPSCLPRHLPRSLARLLFTSNSAFPRSTSPCAPSRFSPGALQFEVGIQTFDETAAHNISRRQDYAKLANNFHFLRDHTGVHIHADLIAGLPGETLDTFAAGFDQLVNLRPQEIQVGILERLRVQFSIAP